MLLHPALFALCPWPPSLPLQREVGDAKPWGEGRGWPAGLKRSYWCRERARKRLELKRGKEGLRGGAYREAGQEELSRSEAQEQ